MFFGANPLETDLSFAIPGNLFMVSSFKSKSQKDKILGLRLEVVSTAI